jgi:hypothetical protein
VCRRVILVLLVAMFAFLTATAAAFAYLEWWQALLVAPLIFVAVAWLAKTTIKLMIRRAFGGRTTFEGGLGNMMAGMFAAKGKALHNATVTVHSVIPTTEPPEGQGEEEEDESEDDSEALIPAEDSPPVRLKWYTFDVTITPDRVQHSEFGHWDIDDLVLVPFDAVFAEGLEDLDRADEFALINTRIVESGRDTEFDEAKVAGPRRLRFVAGIDENVRTVKFRYYFEGFGRIPLPAPS